MENAISLKRNPHGISSFSLIREKNYAYVDKTRFIEVLENEFPPYHFIIRPRRFGKTLFTQTLQAYYDVAAAKDFETNFAGTYIGEHKTKLASSLHVIHFDFSSLESGYLVESFTEKVRDGLHDFCLRYNFEEGLKLLKKKFRNPSNLLDDFACAYERQFKETKIYLIIDEYDNVVNEIFYSNFDAFRKFTNYGGTLKCFYTGLKSLAATGPVSRIFITGVTAIDCDSFSSGFDDIANYITREERFATLFGFTETELRALVPELLDLEKYGKTLDEVLLRMKEWYEGYFFSPDNKEAVFNPSMCLYYLKWLAKTGKEPEKMLDPSVANGLDKLEEILSLANKNLTKDIVEGILRHKAIYLIWWLRPIRLNKANGLDSEELLSFLVYMGFLTAAPGEDRKFIIPNRTIGTQFFEYYFKEIVQAPNYSYDEKAFEAAYKALEAGDPVPWLLLTNSFFDKGSDATGKSAE